MKAVMLYNEFLASHNLKVKNHQHEKIIKLFYSSCWSVCGDINALPILMGELLDIDLADTHAITGCFNGIFDGTIPPFNDVDFYLRFSNDIRIFVYGSSRGKEKKKLNSNEYVLFVLGDKLTRNIERTYDRYAIVYDEGEIE